MLNSRHVDYVVVGAIAVSYHAYPRNTGDLDVLVRPTLETQIGWRATWATLEPRDFIEPGKVIQLGFRPRRIDLFNQVSGVGFDEIWEGRVVAEIDGVAINLIGREAFIKEQAGRDQDRADLKMPGASLE